MKHQISKVVFIATLASIGAGFAGTQQAKASHCPEDKCITDTCTARAQKIRDDKNAFFGYTTKGEEFFPEDGLIVPSGPTIADKNSLCRDCDGVAEGGDGRSPGECISNNYIFSTQYFRITNGFHEEDGTPTYYPGPCYTKYPGPKLAECGRTQAR